MALSLLADFQTVFSYVSGIGGILGLFVTILVIALHTRTLKKGLKDDKKEKKQEEDQMFKDRVEPVVHEVFDKNYKHDQVVIDLDSKITSVDARTARQHEELKVMLGTILKSLDESKDNNEVNFRELLKADILQHCAEIENIIDGRNRMPISTKERRLDFVNQLLDSAFARYIALGGNSIITTKVDATKKLYSEFKVRVLNSEN